MEWMVELMIVWVVGQEENLPGFVSAFRIV